MTQEEKAKRYDEALSLMRDCIPDENGLVHVRPSDIFAELMDEDERIRKALIKYHQRTVDLYGIEGKLILTWLEKQGEEKKQVDGFDAELNALLKKYEHLYKVDIIECLKFYANELKQRMEGEK